MTERYPIPPASTMTLPDGRRLAWYEYGEPAGRPCVYMPGSPLSGVTGLLYDEVARAQGIRLICPDRPGLGKSDFKPDRVLVDWASDVGALVNHLGVDRFAIVGESGGGPHALSVAHGLRNRITLAVLVASPGPMAEPWYQRARLVRGLNRPLFWLAVQSPRLLRAMMGRMMAPYLGERGFDKWLASTRRMVKPTSPDAELLTNRRLQVAGFEGATEAARPGPRGGADDFRVLASPWGFVVEDVITPVALWHGTRDGNVPVEVGHALAARLPSCVTHFVEGAGHSLGGRCAEEILAEVASSFRSTT
ncbi:alpha/beta hydrolase [Polyangium sp. 15x6]|uniref:alpha/beta fold hydrolase n=1 Tax=Polyangium sp. 15x6 TaxID=3042687 RepID=UPI00249CEA10|nr:alpha/beta hydrolase [Polyangium sp. 15x6]MDI3283460.1 alpha/beta hydrolase [Polyangium sp. 15x6]